MRHEKGAIVATKAEVVAAWQKAHANTPIDPSSSYLDDGGLHIMFAQDSGDREWAVLKAKDVRKLLLKMNPQWSPRDTAYGEWYGQEFVMGRSRDVRRAVALWKSRDE